MVEARDEQILRAVAMVDAIPERGAADQIIAPLRPRLARLRPPRPLRFARLLFLPLDPLIVPPARWRLSQPVIPRSVILPFAALVEAALGTEAGPVMRQIEGRTTRDAEVIEAAGQIVWPRAARILRDSPPPAAWSDTGLGVAMYQPLAQRVGALLSQATRLRRLMTDADQGLSPPDIGIVRAIVLDALGLETDIQPMLIALALVRVPDMAPVLSRVAMAMGPRGEALLRGAGEDAADVVLDQLEVSGAVELAASGADLTEAGAEVRRLAALLSTLDGDHLPPARRARVRDLRARVREGCESLFTERLESDLMAPLAGAAPTDGEALESAARGLRSLEVEARRLGGGKSFDTLLHQASGAVRALTARGGLDRAGAVRLTELLSGPEAALALMGMRVEPETGLPSGP